MARQTWADREPVEFTGRPACPAVTAGAVLRAVAFAVVGAVALWCLLTLAQALLSPAPEALPACPRSLSDALLSAAVGAGTLTAVALAVAAWAGRKER